MKNPYEGLTIFDEGSNPNIFYQHVIYGSRESWESRHPSRDWYRDRRNYPDAVRMGEGGKILPRVKKLKDITEDDLREAGLSEHEKALLAEDVALGLAYVDYDELVD